MISTLLFGYARLVEALEDGRINDVELVVAEFEVFVGVFHVTARIDLRSTGRFDRPRRHEVLEAGMTFLLVELPRLGVLVDGVVLVEAIDQIVYRPSDAVRATEPFVQRLSIPGRRGFRFRLRGVWFTHDTTLGSIHNNRFIYLTRQVGTPDPNPAVR